MAAAGEVEIEANGLRFESLVAGPESGETVILLHGYPQSAGSWRETQEWLAGRGYRSIAPNLRGYSPGANPRDASEYSMADLVADVIGIADARGADRFHLVGHDWGGALAWSVAAAHPQRLLSLTSISTPHSAAMLEALRGSTQSLRSVYMGFFRIPRLPEAIMQAGNYAQLGLSLRAFGLPRAAWQRDRKQLQRVGMRGPFELVSRRHQGTAPAPRVGANSVHLGTARPVPGPQGGGAHRQVRHRPVPVRGAEAGHWVPDRNAHDLQRILGEHLEDFGVPVQNEVAGAASAAKRRPAAKRNAPRAAKATRAPDKRARRPPTAPS